MRTIKVEFIGKGFKRVRLQPADDKGSFVGERIDFVFGEAFKKVRLRVYFADRNQMFIPRHSEKHAILGIVNEGMKEVKPHDA